MAAHKYLLLICCMLWAGHAFGQEEKCACCTEDHKAFDFWVGSWLVSNADGTLAGRNTIVKSENNCVIQENWTSTQAGFTGISTNFYNQITKQWEQLWIDSTGGHLKLSGNRIGNQMILASEEFENKMGVLNRNRITWTMNEDGTVRQLWEILEGEKVVGVAFDGLYERVEGTKD
ncbi:hypothetical protein [Maribacter arenosus]|nr:hypothetical protein [Maribacter arenosus]